MDPIDTRNSWSVLHVIDTGSVFGASWLSRCQTSERVQLEVIKHGRRRLLEPTQSCCLQTLFGSVCPPTRVE